MVKELVATRYELLDRIGGGAAAVVYRARDVRLDRTVALKVLRDELAADPEYVERFQREARIAAQLSHPNVAGVHDYGSIGDSAFIAMEYVEGESLKARVKREGALPVGEALSIVRQVLSALSAAHARDMVHRDVKPQNVLLGRDGSVKLTDFGIAQTSALAGLTQTGTTLGTAAYMAPEQVKGSAVGPAADVYACGALLYELLTGHPPFEGKSQIEVALHHVNDPVTPPSEIAPGVPDEVEAATMRALEKDPADRFPSAAAMLAALDGEVDDPLGMTSVFATARMPVVAAGPAASTPSPLAPARPTAARRPRGALFTPPPRRWLIAAGAAVVLLATAAVALGGLPEVRLTRKTDAVTAAIAPAAATAVPQKSATSPTAARDDVPLVVRLVYTPSPVASATPWFSQTEPSATPRPTAPPAPAVQAPAPQPAKPAPPADTPVPPTPALEAWMQAATATAVALQAPPAKPQPPPAASPPAATATPVPSKPGGAPTKPGR